MSLLVAVPCALGAALAYGASTAAQHSAAHDEGRSGGVAGLLRDPRWLLGMGGDTVGLALQIAALATGPVVLVQPILVLALPISLPAAWALGGPRPGPAQYRWCGAIVLGLALFLALAGRPGSARPVTPHVTVIVGGAVVLAGVVVVTIVRWRSGRTGAATAAAYGGVAGAWFGLVAVMMDACSTAWSAHGIGVFRHPSGFVPLGIVVVLGAVSIALTQLAFQVGSLGASFPANLAADPVVAVVLGAALLHEHVPAAAPYVVGYAVGLAAVLFGAIRLAAPTDPGRTGPVAQGAA